LFGEKLLPSLFFPEFNGLSTTEKPRRKRNNESSEARCFDPNTKYFQSALNIVETRYVSEDAQWIGKKISDSGLKYQLRGMRYQKKNTFHTGFNAIAGAHAVPPPLEWPSTEHFYIIKEDDNTLG